MGSVQRSLQSCSDRAGREVKYCLWFPSALGAGAVFWVVVAVDKTHPLDEDAASSLAVLSYAGDSKDPACPCQGLPSCRTGVGFMGSIVPSLPSAQESTTSPSQGSGTADCTGTPHPGAVIHSAAQRFSPQPQPQPGGWCWWQERPSCLSQSAPLSFVIALALLEAE